VIFESVPNFSEGRRADVIEGIVAATVPARLLDVDADADHNRVVVSIAGSEDAISRGLLGAIGEAARRIDLGTHRGVHPRVGAADVIPIIPLGATQLDDCRRLAHEIGRRAWSDLGLPVYFYGHGEGVSLADIRAGRARPDLGGPDHHDTAGAVCIGARHALVAFNVILYGVDLVAARAVARSIRESSAGLRGVQALAFELPGERVQLSMNLFRIDETSPAAVIAELERRGVSLGARQTVGLCPAVVAEPSAGGRLLEGRLAAAAASAAADACHSRGGPEHIALAGRLRGEARDLAQLQADQDAILGGAERAAALIRVLRAAQALEPEVVELLEAAATGFRAAVSPATEAVYRARVDALDARLATGPSSPE
jgi:glutamate formiminotransferase / 5-formyltetrahydrofolate cyclo-ligase